MVEKGEIAHLSNFTFFHDVCCTLKSFDSHISVVVCSFFEFGTSSKWCIREWVKLSSACFPADEKYLLTASKWFEPPIGCINILPNDKISDWSKFKGCADYLILTQIVRFVIYRIENIM